MYEPTVDVWIRVPFESFVTGCHVSVRYSKSRKKNQEELYPIDRVPVNKKGVT